MIYAIYFRNIVLHDYLSMAKIGLSVLSFALHWCSFIYCFMMCLFIAFFTTHASMSCFLWTCFDVYFYFCSFKIIKLLCFHTQLFFLNLLQREKKNLQDLNGVFVFNVAERENLDRPTARFIKEFDQVEGKFYWIINILLCWYMSHYEFKL